MATKILGTSKRTVTLDARPDRPDLRDRIYQPPLVSLPHQYPPPEWIKTYLPRYSKAGLILDQGEEGACTGFGLAESGDGGMVTLARCLARLAQVLEEERVVEELPAFSILSVHGCFDNWIEGIGRTLARILGLSSPGKMPVRIQSLRGF